MAEPTIETEIVDEALAAGRAPAAAIDDIVGMEQYNTPAAADPRRLPAAGGLRLRAALPVLLDGDHRDQTRTTS